MYKLGGRGGRARPPVSLPRAVKFILDKRQEGAFLKALARIRPRSQMESERSEETVFAGAPRRRRTRCVTEPALPEGACLSSRRSERVACTEWIGVIVAIAERV